MASLAEAVEIPDSSDDEAVKAVKWTGTGKADAPLKIESDSDDEPAAKRSRTAPAAPVPAPVKAARSGSLDTDGDADADAFATDKADASVGGIWHVGMRQGPGADKTGARSLSEHDYEEILRRIGFEVAFDMRRGTLRTKCQKKKGGPCGATPSWTCNCPKDSRIQAIHERNGCAYETRGIPLSKNGSGHNLGGSEVTAYPGRGVGVKGSPFLKNSGEIRRAMLDPRNTGGRPCLDEDKKSVPGGVRFDPDAYAALKAIADLSKTKRVVLLFVEDNMSDCHVKDLIAVMLEHKLIDSATAVEPTAMRPGAGWTNCTCARHVDWKGDLKRVKAARYGTRNK